MGVCLRFTPRTQRGRETLAFYLLISPKLFGFAFFIIGPMIASMVISLTNWTITAPAAFVGISNYTEAFTDPLFWQSLKVTTYYSVVAIPLHLIFALALAVLMNQKVIGIRFWRTVYYLPAIVPSVAASVLWIYIFAPTWGLLDGLIRVLFHVTGPDWLGTEQTVIPSLILMSLWGVGGGMVIYLASLQGVPTELYEAAELDGAGRVRKFLHITLPMITPVIFFNLVMGIIGSFQTFTQSFVMTNGGPSNASLFYLLYLYRNAWGYLQMGYASALAWILFAILLALTVVVVHSSSAWVYYEGIKR